MLLLIATSLAAISLLILLASPLLGIPLLLFSKPIIDTTFDKPLLFDFPLTQIVGTAVPLIMFTWMLRASRDEGLGRMPLKNIWTVYAVYVFLFSTFIVYNEGIIRGLDVFLRHINGFIGFYMFQAFFHEKRKIKILLWSLAIAGIFPVAVGIYQFFTGKIWHLQQTEGMIRSIGMYHDVLTARLYPLQAIIALLLLTSLYYRRNLAVKLTSVFYGVAAIWVIVRAYSKAGIFILLLWNLWWTVLQRKFVALAAMVGVLFVGLPFYAEELVNQIGRLFRKELGALGGEVKLQDSFEGRWYGWQEMLDQWQDVGFLGKVFGSGIKAYGAHNDYLQILFHGGVVGLAIYVFLLVCIGTKIVANLRAGVDPLRVAALMLFTMYLIDTVGLVPSSYPAYQWMVWGLIGLSFRMRDEEKSDQKHQWMKTSPSRATKNKATTHNPR